MRICFIADINHPNTLNWVKYFSQELDHDIHVITLNPPIESNNQFKTYHLKFLTNSKLKYLFSAGGLGKTIQKISPDLLIGYRLTSYAYMAARTGFHPLVVVAQSQKAAGDYRIIRKPVQWLAARYAVRHCDIALAWASHIAKDIISLGGNKNKIFVMPRGVDLRNFNYNPKQESKGLTIITTRGLNPGYNLETVFLAVSKLSMYIQDIKYIVVGDGAIKENLTQLSKRLNITSRVEFTGKVPYDSIPQYLQCADIYISPVPEDGVSSSLLEAMAVGIFPIVADIKANTYWNEEGCNFSCFDPNSVDDLVHMVMNFYQNRKDLPEQLSLNRQIVEKKASWVDNMKAIENVLKDLIRIEYEE